MSIDQLTGGNIEPRGLEEEMRSSYLDYAMSVIVGRALPDVRDGLKPVHRRILYSMYDSGLQPGRPHRKCANVVGGVMGNYHPHGDSAIYDALVRLGQDFAMRYPLIDPQGNFGSIDNDSPAAMRYTEARLSRLATEMLRDIDADTVEFGPNYDESRQEPLVLPSRFPNLLVNGSSGIAVGMATNIPPHNLSEPMERGKERIIVTEMPFQVYKGDGRGDGSGLMQKIVEQVQNGRLKEISDLRDESDKTGIRLVIELKRDAIPKVVLNKLYKHTQLQTTFGVNMVALVDGVPRTLGLLPIVRNYVDHQRDVIVRRTKYELAQREARLHILEGLLVAIANIDEVIELIRGSRDPDTARDGLMERFELSRLQAQAILDLRLQRLTALQTDEIKTEHADVVERIKYLREILGDEANVMGLIREELLEIKQTYGDERRTEATHSEDEIDIEDLIADQQMVIAITHSGYIKSLPLATYRMQRRGGIGVTGMDMKDDDYIEHLFVCSTHDYLLFFTNRGKVYRQKVYELPQGSRAGTGPALVNVLPLREGEFVRAVISTRAFSEGRYLVFGTRNGLVKKTELGAYNTPIKADGIIAINIRDADELVAVRRVDEGDEVLMVSKEGLAVRFTEDDARSMGRDTSGVRGMDVKGDNEVIAMDIARDDQYLLVVTENGFGKRTLVGDYRKTSRGAKGVKTIQQTEAKGALAAALVVRDHHQLVFISQNGMVQRIAVRELRPLGRNAQGFRLMNVRDDDLVSAVALVVENETSDAVADDAPVSIDASGVADEPALAGDGVIVGDPDADELLDVPEVDADEGMPDSDLEE